MTFKLSKRSLRNLEGVHPALVEVVRHAIQLSTVDFMVAEGRRTVERQRQLFKAGATRTMNSRHLTGHAVDLAAWVGGGVRWDWPLYPQIAEAMRAAADVEKVRLVWGGCWDTPLAEIHGTCAEAAEDYTARRRAEGRRSFIDGPHYELDREAYP